MKIQKILVAVDFSPESQVAVEQAVSIARKQDARLVLLHVGYVPEEPAGVPTSMHGTVSEYLRVVEQELAKDRAQLAELRERVSGSGVEVSHMVIDASPVQGICRAAEELDADLVVTGSHGRTGIKRFVLGSVAERVVRMSERSVLVARDGATGTGGYHRILVPTDFSPCAEQALQMALMVAAEGATIDLLHCWYLPPMSYPYLAPTKSAMDLMAPLRDSIISGAESLAKKLIATHQQPGVTLAFHQTEASPAAGIQSWLEQSPYEIVITGSHGRRGPARFLLGSVAELTVRHAPCSVMVVHNPAERADQAHDDQSEQAG